MHTCVSIHIHILYAQFKLNGQAPSAEVSNKKHLLTQITSFHIIPPPPPLPPTPSHALSLSYSGRKSSLKSSQFSIRTVLLSSFPTVLNPSSASYLSHHHSVFLSSLFSVGAVL